MGAGEEILGFDPMNPAWAQDPWPHLRKLREADPVHWSEKHNCWVLTRYGGYLEINDDPRFGRWRGGRIDFTPPTSESEGSKLAHFFGNHLARLEGEEHARVRALTRRAFAPSAIKRLRPMIRDLASSLLDGFASEKDVDLKPAYSDLIPIKVIGRMLGIPAESELEVRFKHLADTIALVSDATRFEKQYGEINAAVEELSDHFSKLVVEKRAKPAEDILSYLTEKHDDGDSLSAEELNSLLLIIILGGTETTANTIAHGVIEFSRNRELVDRLAKQPELWPKAMDELVRLQLPLHGSERHMTEDVEFGGKTLHKGDTVYFCRSAMFRDPEVFPNPDRFDLDRNQAESGQAFGVGEHFCIGSHLARAELEIALESLFTRYPRLALASDALDYDLQTSVRAVRSLKVRLEP